VWRVRSEYVAGTHEVVTGRTFADQVVAARYDPPASWPNGRDFRDITAKVVATAPARTLDVPPRTIHRSRFSGVLDVPDGPSPFATNIAGGPRFVTMTGIRAIGRTSDGFVVAVRAADAPAAGPIRVTIEPVRSAVLRLGTIISIVSGLLLLALIVWVLGRFVAGRRRRPRSGDPGRPDGSAAPPREAGRPMELVGSAPTGAR
jgi:hypothetical protein